MLRIPKNKYIITYLSFTGGFLLFFLAQLVFAVALPAPLTDNTVSPSVHSLNIAGGATDTDNNGVSIDNDGKIDIHTGTLTGSYSNPQYGLYSTSTKGGLHVSAPYNPIAGINSVNTTPNPDEYGRIGVEGRVIGNEYGGPSLTKGFLGYIQHASIAGMYQEYQPLPANVPNALIPYAFYTTGNTYLGDTVTIDGDIKNGASGVTIAADVSVNGNMKIDGNLETDVLNFSNVSNLDDRFITENPDLVSLGNISTFYADTEILTASGTCPPNAYLVGCSGHIINANAYAPYRGAVPSSNLKGGSCTAYASVPPGAPDFTLFATPYCFNLN